MIFNFDKLLLDGNNLLFSITEVCFFFELGLIQFIDGFLCNKYFQLIILDCY